MAFHSKNIFYAGRSTLPVVCIAIKGPLYVAAAHIFLVPTLGTFVRKRTPEASACLLAALEYILLFCGSVL